MNPAAVPQLVTHLRNHRTAITEAWLQAVRSDPEITSAQRLAPAELTDHFPALFNDLINYFQVSAAESARQRVRQEARRHGDQRWNQSYRLIELLRELGTAHHPERGMLIPHIMTQNQIQPSELPTEGLFVLHLRQRQSTSNRPTAGATVRDGHVGAPQARA